jgi:hypothetical protein
VTGGVEALRRLLSARSRPKRRPSELHRILAAAAGPQQYLDANADGHQGRHPFCMTCKWDQVADPDRMQMRNYFAMTDSGAAGFGARSDAFDDAALDLLTGWQSAS